MWQKHPRGTPLPYVQNAMTRDAYEFMRQCIHFSDNSKRVPFRKDAAVQLPGYDPLFKVRLVLDVTAKGLQGAWKAGKEVTIDESMIKYCGRAVTFVQYMPLKPIKHGIKVFCICCGLTAVIMGFKVYVSKLDNEDHTAKEIVEKLIQSAGLTDCRGRTLYTDNWYTSIPLAEHLFEKYGWMLVGTVSPTDKFSRKDKDVPFRKLSNGARKKVERGWFREAVLKMKTPTGGIYYIQVTTWRDKKQVMFISSNHVGASSGFEVTRQEKGVDARKIRSCRAQVSRLRQALQQSRSQ